MAGATRPPSPVKRFRQRATQAIALACGTEARPPVAWSLAMVRESNNKNTASFNSIDEGKGKTLEENAPSTRPGRGAG